MTQYRQILRLHSQGISQQSIYFMLFLLLCLTDSKFTMSSRTGAHYFVAIPLIIAISSVSFTGNGYTPKLFVLSGK